MSAYIVEDLDPRAAAAVPGMVMVGRPLRRGAQLALAVGSW